MSTDNPGRGSLLVIAALVIIIANRSPSPSADKPTPTPSCAVIATANEVYRTETVITNGKKVVTPLYSTAGARIVGEHPNADFRISVPEYEAGTMKGGDRVTVLNGEIIAAGCADGLPEHKPAP